MPYFFKWYGNKFYWRIGAVVIELGWYRGEDCVLLDAKAIVVDRSVQMMTVLYVQITKLALCISVDLV